MLNQRTKKPTSNKKPSASSKRFYRYIKGLGKVKIIAFVLLFAAIGVSLHYFSLAASFNVNDETIQVFDINKTRTALGKSKLIPSSCMQQVARNWSRNMSQNGFRHNPDFGGQIRQACNISFLAWAGENIAMAGNYCSPTSTMPDTCSQDLYKALYNSPGHYANIISNDADYVGIGSYRDDMGRVWITQEFAKCDGCNLATYPITYWTLHSAVSASTSTASRALNINASVGQEVTFYHDIKNNGPVPATYPTHVDTYHYASSGALIGSSQIILPNQTTGWGRVFVWTNKFTIPSSATKGQKYCHAIYYGNASGPGTHAAISTKTCVTVV